MNVYVVIVETGEYSDRCDWIGGVFTDCAEAERYIVEKSAAARQQKLDYDAWCKKRMAICVQMFGFNSYPWQLKPEAAERLELEIGKAPKGQSGDAFYLVEVPLNQWGTFFYAGHERTPPATSFDTTGE